MNKEWLGSGWVRTIAVGALLLVVLGIALFPLFDGKIVFEDDVTNYYLPAFHLYANAMASGDGVAITPGVFSGFPLALSQVGGFFDPINVLLFKLFPYLGTYHVRILLNYFVAGLFTYLFARSLRLSPLASVVAMFAYVTAQHLIPGANILRSNSLYLMPALFLVIHGLYLTTSERRWHHAAAYAALGVGVLVVAFLGGYTQLNLYSIVAAGTFALYLAYQRSSWQFLLWVTAMFVAGFALLAPYILAVLDLATVSARSGGLDWEAASAGTNALRFVQNVTINLFIPPWDGGTLQSLYIGSVSVFFFLASWFAIKTKSFALFFWGLLGFSLLSAIPYPLFYLMHLLPVFDLFRFPPHWLFVGSFATSVLAAIGFEYLQTSDRFPKVRNLLLQAGGLGIVILLMLNFVLLAWFTINRFTIPITALTDKPWVVAAIEKQEEANSAPFRTFQWYPNETINSLLRTGIHPTGEQGEWLNSQYVQTHLTPLVWGIDTVRGFDNLEPRRYARVLAYLDDIHNVFGSVATADTLPVPTSMLSLLGMMNVRYFWSVIPVEGGGVTLVSSKNFDYASVPFSIYLYRNSLFLPRVFVPSSIEVLPKSEESFPTIIDGSANYATKSFIECDECDKGILEQHDSIEINGISTQNDTVSFTTSSAAAHWILISNSFVPGWHAYIDGQEVPIHYANYIYQGILVPAGQHAVSVRYRGPYANLFSI